MRKILPVTILVISILLCLPTKNFAQYLNLGKIENCTIFTVNGAVANTTVSTYNGIIGADAGTISGFDANSTSYTIHSSDTFTKQATTDILNAYILLNNVPVTDAGHLATFSGTINPGVYLVGSAGGIAGAITLDGKGDPNAVFIFKFQGTFSISKNSTIVLANSARAANVFWIAEGAIDVNKNCTVVGTLLAHPGAISFLGNSNIEGRMLSTTGAVSFGNGNAVLPDGPSTIPISCVTTCDNPILASAANFTLFTALGALSNTGISGVIGKIGADNAGSSITGFSTSIVIGSTEFNNSVTNQAATDLSSAFTKLYDTIQTPINVVHASDYGSTGGETLKQGVYHTYGTALISNLLILDGENNENSTFVFQIEGTFNSASNSRVVLINGARRCNIFWVAKGSVTLGTLSFMKGNVMTNAAIGTTGQVFLEGRLLTTAGACAFNTSTTYISNSLCAGSLDNSLRILPVQLTVFTGNCNKQNIVLQWTTATEANNEGFDVERSNDGKNWQLVGNVAGAGNSDVVLNYSLVDNLPSINNTLFYRLKQTDIDNNFKYSKVITVSKCGASEEANLSISPNPSSGQFNFNFNGDKSLISSTEIFNMQGEKIYQSNSFQAKINLSNQAAGIYLVRVHLNSKIIIRKIVLSK